MNHDPNQPGALSAECMNDGGLLLKGRGFWGAYEVRFNANGELVEGYCELSPDRPEPCGDCGDDEPVIGKVTRDPNRPSWLRRWWEKLRHDVAWTWPPGPGDALAWGIMLVTLGCVRPCRNCKSRRARLNELGWRGLTGWLRGLLRSKRNPVSDAERSQHV